MASTTTTNPMDTVTTTLKIIGNGTPILCDSPYPLITTTGASAHPEISKDHYCVEAAYTMAQIHNTILRGINSIYNQCLTIQPGTSQAADFITYNQFVYDFLHHHHRNEEDVFFPFLQKVTGDDKFCEVETQEHAEFDIGAEKWKQYIFIVKPEDYDGIKLRDIIEGFGRPLHTHLVAEIEWLLTLSKYDSRGCEKAFLDTGKKAEAEMSFYKDLPLILSCQDNAFTIDGRKGIFPPMPTPLLYIAKWYWSKRYASIWKFSPSDCLGKRKNGATA